MAPRSAESAGSPRRTSERGSFGLWGQAANVSVEAQRAKPSPALFVQRPLPDGKVGALSFAFAPIQLAERQI